MAKQTGGDTAAVAELDLTTAEGLEAALLMVPDEDLRAQLQATIDNLQSQIKTRQAAVRKNFRETFLANLDLTEVDEPGGRKADKIADGYAKTYTWMVETVGDELNDYVAKHGFTLSLYAALMQAYYSPEGRQVRGEKPRTKAEAKVAEDIAGAPEGSVEVPELGSEGDDTES